MDLVSALVVSGLALVGLGLAVAATVAIASQVERISEEVDDGDD